MFIIGTGRIHALLPPRYWNRLNPSSADAALAAARDTDRIALAPRWLLLAEPSMLIRI